MNKVRNYIWISLISALIVVNSSCSKLVFQDKVGSELNWLCTVSIPGYDTIWPNENPYNLESAAISYKYFSENDPFHFYINNELIGINQYSEFVSDIDGSNTIDPSDFNVWYSDDDSVKPLRLLGWYHNLSDEFSDKQLTAVLDFPVNYNTTQFSDTVHYAIFEIKFNN